MSAGIVEGIDHEVLSSLRFRILFAEHKRGRKPTQLCPGNLIYCRRKFSGKRSGYFCQSLFKSKENTNDLL